MRGVLLTAVLLSLAATYQTNPPADRAEAARLNNVGVALLNQQLMEKAIEKGMLTLRRSGLIKIKNGVTSVEEVLRETVRDEI